ncbi:TVP38/TMEM64 family protein [Arhodomonas sp. SL1]|uniref:TVP38/TMEM64 family protein n=1 Tax=Arhodomonas sp. SL1 TaxID=3425691 RepID=UPI003F882827
MPRRLWLVLVFLVTVLGLAALWQYLALNDWITTAMIREWVMRVAALGEWEWMPVVLMAAYVLASLVVFPLSILVAVTGLLYGSVSGSLYALVGTLLAAAVTYWLGRLIGREAVVRHGGRRLNTLARALSARGVRTMIVVSLLPLAPFTVTNLVAGAFHLRFRDYMLGTLIGILPGLLAMTVLGSQLATLLTAESLDTVAWALAGMMAVVVVIGVLRMLAARKERRATQADGPAGEED